MLAFILAQFVLVGSEAHARDCVTGEAGSGFVAMGCDAGTLGADICEEVDLGGGTIAAECEATRQGSANPASVIAETLSSDDGYVIFGYASSGSAFCCAFDDGSDGVAAVSIELSSHDDEMHGEDLYNTGFFSDIQFLVLGGDGEDEIHGPEAAGTGSSGWAGEDGDDDLYCYDDSVCSGGGGDDTLVGNDDANYFVGDVTPYCAGSGADDFSTGGGDDYIYGCGGADTIDAGADDDIASGGTGTNTIDGGSGLDWLYGSYDADLLIGGAGDDILEGNGGNDILRGGVDDDLLLGGDGDDFLCSGSTTFFGDDIMHGGNDDDVFWAPSSNANPTGTDSGGSDLCGHSSHGSFLTSGSCSYTLTSAPSECT
jgi:Ca2+-binding RTX toxin-like protein